MIPEIDARQAIALAGQGANVSEIARRLGHDRKTIRIYLNGHPDTAEAAAYPETIDMAAALLSTPGALPVGPERLANPARSARSTSMARHQPDLCQLKRPAQVRGTPPGRHICHQTANPAAG
jgi:hypothetical protein